MKHACIILEILLILKSILFVKELVIELSVEHSRGFLALFSILLKMTTSFVLQEAYSVIQEGMQGLPLVNREL